MLLSKKKQLRAMLDRAKQQDAPYFYLKLKFQWQTDKEVIINSMDVADGKFNYIDGAYDEDLFMKQNKGIHIESFGYLHEYNMVEDFMEEEEV